MKIAIDLDEVLADTMPALLSYYNERFKTSYRFEDCTSYKFWEFWGGSKQRAIDIVHDFYATELFLNIKPVIGSVDAVFQLAKDHELIIVTSRQNDIVSQSHEWVEKYYPRVFSNIFFTNAYSKNGEKILKKSDICNEQNVDVFIDDLLNYFVECTNKSRKTILFNAPWNIHKNIDGVDRAETWKDVQKIINKKE